jgi:hypothetical protein
MPILFRAIASPLNTDVQRKILSSYQRKMDERGCMKGSGKYLKSGNFQPEWWQLWPGIGGNFETEWVAVLLRIMHNKIINYDK